MLKTCGAPIWKSIAAGMSHSLAVSASGTVYTCGNNQLGQLGLPNLDPPTVKYFTRIHTLQLGVFDKVFAGFNHSFALIDPQKIKRNYVESFDQIPAPEFACEKKLNSYRSLQSHSLKELNDGSSGMPKDTLGWILEY